MKTLKRIHVCFGIQRIPRTGIQNILRIPCRWRAQKKKKEFLVCVCILVTKNSQAQQ